MKRGQPNSNQVDPFRKRSFDPAQDVALMLHAFKQEMGVKETWHINQALREYLTAKGYAKRLPALKRQFVEA